MPKSDKICQKDSSFYDFSKCTCGNHKKNAAIKIHDDTMIKRQISRAKAKKIIKHLSSTKKKVT